MTNPRLKHGPKLEYSSPDMLTGDLDHANQRPDIDTQTETTRIDLCRLFEMARNEPLRAVIECQNNVSKLELGYQKQRRRYIGVSYAIAFSIFGDDDLLTQLDQLLVKHGIIKKSNVENTRARLIFRVFQVTFASKDETSANSAYRYAYGLDHFLDSGASPESVAKIVIEYGPEKLYKSAVASSKVDQHIAEVVHSKRLNRAMRDGQYAAKLLAEHQGQSATTMSKQDKSYVGGNTSDVELEEKQSPELDDDEDTEEERPSWRSTAVTKHFDKMISLSAQLNAEIVESKAVLENEGEGNEDDLLRDEQDDNKWKTDEIQSCYELLSRRAVQTNAEIAKLRELLKRQID